jgi:hypothetical protein
LPISNDFLEQHIWLDSWFYPSSQVP